MNEKRRKQIKEVINNLERILDDEQDYYDNIPENLQSSKNAETSEEAIDNLQDAIDSLENIC